MGLELVYGLGALLLLGGLVWGATRYSQITRREKAVGDRAAQNLSERREQEVDPTTTPRQTAARGLEDRPDHRASTTAWPAFAVGAVAVFVAIIGAALMFGVPGTTGGTSTSQQQTSGAPQPSTEIRDGRTQETTGYRPGPDAPR